MSRICTICARGGSKGVKNKNIKILLDKPLIAHSIHQAKKSGLFDVVAVSSESREILKISGENGADLLIQRPMELATDNAAKIPVIQHCLATAEEITGKSFNTIVDLDATSPLRLVTDIVQAVEMFEHSDASNLITAMKSRRSPYFNLVEINKEGFVELSKKMIDPIIRRQDSPKCYDMNASIYVWRKETLLDSSSVFQSNTILYEMPEERSIDIDSELDFEIVSLLAKKRGGLI
ncbi:cytidylyltransferase domain-containing protein [Paucisalibacillus globulus]|uniref:acylneuraminate cytidylyltransferase family protein n=1 Tax=Paucisalibacillus globulus TaxID=351095 RepID=UPI000429EDE6|nr:acylneuraminate cytidylyltransferase family protein [Paucisalibacillus globulus]